MAAQPQSPAPVSRGRALRDVTDGRRQSFSEMSARVSSQ